MGLKPKSNQMVEMLDQLSENENLGFSIPKNRDDLTITSAHKYKDRRNNPRFYLYFEAIISNTHQSVRTRTLNLSTAGAMLEHSLPLEFNQGPIEVTIVASPSIEGPKIYLKFKAVLVGGPNHSSRLRFTSDENYSFEKLKVLMSQLFGRIAV